MKRLQPKAALAAISSDFSRPFNPPAFSRWEFNLDPDSETEDNPENFGRPTDRRGADGRRMKTEEIKVDF